MKKPVLLLLASTALGSNALATAERALMSPTDIKAMYELAHKLDPMLYEEALNTVIENCNKPNSPEYLASIKIMREITGNIPALELKNILERNIEKVVKKSTSLQDNSAVECDNCDLLIEDIAQLLDRCDRKIALEKNQLAEVATTEIEKELKTELSLTHDKQ